MKIERENAILRELSRLMLIGDVKIECFKNGNDEYETMIQIEGNDIIYIPKGTIMDHKGLDRAIDVRKLSNKR